MKRVAYPIEETIARIEEMPWPRRAKEIMAQTLQLGRLPAQADRDGGGGRLRRRTRPGRRLKYMIESIA